MLDMGFQEDVEHIIKPSFSQGDFKPQVLLWSATVPPFVQKIAKRYLSDTHELIDLVGSDRVQTSTTVKHLAVECNPSTNALTQTIGSFIKKYAGVEGRCIVFCETKRQTDEL